MFALLSNVPVDGDGSLFGNRCQHTEPKHFTLMMACAEICRTSAHFMLLGSDLHKLTCRECAEICEQCAADCERVGEMRECTDACRRCAASCQKMAT